MELETLRRLNDDLQRVSLPPHVTSAWAQDENASEYFLTLEAPRIPDADNSGCLVAGGVSAVFPIPDDVHGLAIDVAAAHVYSAVHEAIEWTAVDGERLADPHPPNSDEMWQWLAGATRQLIQDYIDRFGTSHPVVS